jgi:hypothetical protein
MTPLKDRLVLARINVMKSSWVMKLLNVFVDPVERGCWSQYLAPHQRL